MADIIATKALASLVDHIRLTSFPKELADYLATLAHFDTCLMLVFVPGAKPTLVYTETSEPSPALETYLHHSYLLDPLYSALQNNASSSQITGLSRLSSIAPDSFTQTEYFHNCYQEFDLVDEINLVIELAESSYFTLSLGRKSSLGSITRAEMNRLQEHCAMISALIRQFWLSNADEYLPNGKSRSTLTQALRTFGQGVLTRREQEITALILQGHSSQSIADLLNICVGTVKVHRKNIHGRLNTSQQSEIFTLFLNHLSEMDMRIVA
ncbi:MULTISPECIES: helix-turn-helix transcriptional regulator [unclassified Oceanobacter]|jgi:DNA-binding CsgD family transcriptional regulator|uniref:helix-turn-helix domain-containing protein n=1 Tax=unclassified Oceanobacter TaxID=2620260 RepID=UPI0026E2812D|nr:MULTISPECIES: helix-turn-helix transcriptional regulator [unclassified Oceanobacter]MDO6682680.1 helix-turn-helix transcriptional regulator [Oceanobacter sp. 5_MG-2023]MDP2505813.1 helix-turn-helix transcriptional regulator [Oceanobacter sp. 3_MG-2023]MDP2549348.1 helix-turn-helix transcriptional regulator [Oceanobacter sp. 4_MG-2023]MDP2609101.1 helix-turn-helix transcriptional regulator [Oceanobacter sp. 1_MG-2023]MDP2612423.1 helix-turn-helix transcriptional regulator [Oceanobacter sp. 2